MVINLLHLCRASLWPPPIKRLTTYFPTVIRSYNIQQSKESHGHGTERARTTAEEFERVAEEFQRVAEAKARQTIEKAHDGAQEAAGGDSGVKSIKEKYKEEPGYLHKTAGDE